MKGGACIAVGLIILGGILVMLRNWIEYPDNSSGGTSDGFTSGGGREHHFPHPPEMEREAKRFRHWWEW